MVRKTDFLLAGASAFALAAGAAPAFAQQTETPASAADAEVDVIIVEGFRAGLDLARQIARDSDTLVDVIAAEGIGKLPDTNIAEALNRVNSIYLVPDQGEGRYVSIRGVDPILNNVTLNGQTVAVSDTDGRGGRAAPLDVLSASSVSLVEVFKVTLPNMDGQSIGGTINIRTPSAYDYEDGFASLSADIGYNDFGDENEIYTLGGAYGLTFGDADQFGLFLSAEHWVREYLSHLYENPRASTPDEVTGGGLADFLYPERVRFGSAIGRRERSSISANFEIRPDAETQLWARAYYTEYVDEEVRPEFTIRNRGDIVATGADEFHWTRYRIENETRYERQERPVTQFTIGGSKSFNDAWSVESNLTYTEAEEINPYLNYYETETQSDRITTLDPAAAPIRFTLDADGFATPVYNPAATGGLTPDQFGFHQISRLRNITSEVREETMTFDFDAAYETDFMGAPTVFEFGVKYIDRDKSVDDDDNRFPYIGSGTLADAGAGILFADLGRIWFI